MEGAFGEALEHWRETLGEARGPAPLQPKDNVYGFEASFGGAFVVKRVPGDQGLLEAERRLLLHLAERGVPVALPVLTSAGSSFAIVGDEAYVVTPRLPQDDRPPTGAPAMATVGAALARLHQALAAYPVEVRSWTVDWPRQVMEEYVPTLRSCLVGGARDRFETAMATLLPELESALASLPLQRIHGDCHEGNVLFHDGRVSGFLDFDHLPIGPRVYDLGWFFTNRAKALVDDEARLRGWLSEFGALVAGYEGESPFSPRERFAVRSGTLAFQLLFWAWLLKQGGAPDEIDRVERTFHWTFRHRDGLAPRGP